MPKRATIGADALFSPNNYNCSTRNNRDIITATTPNGDLGVMLAGATADVLVGGHTHTPLFRRFRGSLLLNPGSVGLPFVSRGMEWNEDPWNPPWAEYLIISTDRGGLDVQFRRVAVDVAAVLRVAKESGMPHADWWCQDWQT